MTTKTYIYSPKNEPNISLAGTTVNYIFNYTPTYVGIVPVYETAVAGSLQTVQSVQNFSKLTHNSTSKN